MENKMQPEIRFSGTIDYWKQYKLGDLVERLKSYSLSRDVQSIERTGYKYIHYGDIHTGKASFITNDSNIPNIKAGNYEVLREGDVVVADASEDHTGIATPSIVMEEPKFRLVAGLHTIALRPQKVFPIYLYYLLNSQTFKKYGNKAGTGMKVFGISFINLAKFETLIPNLEEQKEIGSFLRKLDQTISLHQQELTTLKKTKQGFLQKMFPKEGKKVPEIRIPGFTDDWQQHKLGDLAESFEYGLNSSAKKFDGKHKYIRITDIDDSSHNFIQNGVTSPDVDFTKVDNYKLQVGDILLARTGASVGKSYHYTENDGLVYYAGFLIRARIKFDINSEFIFQNTLTNNYAKFIKITSQRSGQPGVNAEEYSNFKIMIPDYEEQQKIGSFFKQFDETIALHQRELELLQLTKKAFLQKLFV